MAHAVGVMNGNFRNGHYYQYRLRVEADARREAQERAEQRCKMMFNDVIQNVRDTFETQAEYNSWWEAAPEDGFFEHAEAYLLEAMAQDRNNILVTRRDSLLAAMREEAMSKETATAIIDELAEIETALQAGGYVEADVIENLPF